MIKNTILSLLVVIGFCSCAIGGKAVTMQQMRFHCEKDTTEINDLLKKGLESDKKSGNELVSFYAHELLGTPYVAHTLEGETENLTINIDELDCTTFVETLYALARTTMDGKFSWRDYANNLENLRYRGGHLDGYASRLHYISEWAVDNISRGNIEELTKDLPGARSQTKNIDFMSKHRDLYPSLKDSVTFEQIKRFESGYRNHLSYYVKKELLNEKELKKAIKEGDFVGLVTKQEGLDVSHMGIIVKDEKGNLVVLDASMTGKKVMQENETIVEYLRHKKNNIGVRIFRIKKKDY